MKIHPLVGLFHKTNGPLFCGVLLCLGKWWIFQPATLVYRRVPVVARMTSPKRRGTATTAATRWWGWSNDWDHVHRVESDGRMRFRGGPWSVFPNIAGWKIHHHLNISFLLEKVVNFHLPAMLGTTGGKNTPEDERIEPEKNDGLSLLQMFLTGFPGFQGCSILRWTSRFFLPGW